jgi:hypothetical protein
LRPSVPEKETQTMLYFMDYYEKEGKVFNELMNHNAPYPTQVQEGPTKEKLLDSINPNMKLTESFFKQIYGYDITWAGFAEVALQKLEAAGSTKARGYYNYFADKYEQQHAKAMKAGNEETQKQQERRKVEKEHAGTRNINRRNDRFRAVSQNW